MLTPFHRFILSIAVSVFFQCVATVFSPAHRRGEPIKWGLVSYTTVVLLLVTAQTAINFHIPSIPYIDNREFPGVEDLMSPGPIGHELFISP